MDPVVHFEMPYENQQRMTKFYESVFGWKMQILGEDMGSYVLVTTTETAERGPNNASGIDGGFYPKNPDLSGQYPSVVISVHDIKASIKLVINAGGKVLGEPMEIEGVGPYVSFIDTEGNRVSMLQPIPHR